MCVRPEYVSVRNVCPPRICVRLECVPTVYLQEIRVRPIFYSLELDYALSIYRRYECNVMQVTSIHS